MSAGSQALPVGIIDASVSLPGRADRLVRFMIAGPDPEAELPERLARWCEKHGVCGRVVYRYQGRVDFGDGCVTEVGSGGPYARGDDIYEPYGVLEIPSPGETPDEGDIPF